MSDEWNAVPRPAPMNEVNVTNLTQAIYEAICKYAGKVSVAEVLGCIELVKVQVVRDQIK